MGKNRLTSYLYIFYAFVFILNLVNVFIRNEALNYTIGILAIVMLIISFPKATKLFKVLGIVFAGIGGIAIISTNQPISSIPEYMTSNVSLLTLLMMLPWMNSVVRSGRFDRSLNKLLHVNANHLGELYPRSSAITFTLAAFLNLSAATISQEVLKANLKDLNREIRNTFIASATLRGYTLALLWSPLEIILAIAIFTTGVHYISILPWLLVILVVMYVLDSLWGKWHFRKEASNLHSTIKINKKNLLFKLTHLMIALVLFLTLVIILGNVWNLDFILTVTLLIFPFATVWALIMRRFYSFWRIGWNTWKEKTNTMQNFIVLFLTLSLFSKSIEDTSFLVTIEQSIFIFKDWPFIIFLSIQLIFIILSFLGVHSIGTIGILTGVFSVLIESYNPVSIAILIITGAVSTFAVSTYGLVVQITSMNTGQNPYRITWTNLPYSITLSFIGAIVAYLLL